MREGTITVRAGRTGDASAIHSLIEGHVREGHLLPRTMPDLQTQATRFVVALLRRRVVGCAELAPLRWAVGAMSYNGSSVNGPNRSYRPRG